jgi:hypothetical protein
MYFKKPRQRIAIMQEQHTSFHHMHCNALYGLQWIPNFLSHARIASHARRVVVLLAETHHNDSSTNALQIL